MKVAFVALSCAGVAAALPTDCMGVNGLAEALIPHCAIVTKFCANQGASNDGAMNNEGLLGNDGMVANEGILSNDGLTNSGFFADAEFAAAHDSLANAALLGEGLLANLGFDLAVEAAMVHADICQALTDCGAFLPGGALGECADAAPEEACLPIFVGDGICDLICNTAENNFDGGDCAAAAPGAETLFTFATATETETATETLFTFATETATERCVVNP